jgi:hypothetical protein
VKIYVHIELNEVLLLDCNFVLRESDINYIQSHIYIYIYTHTHTHIYIYIYMYMSVHCGYSVTKVSKAETPFVRDNESVSSHKHGIKFLGLSSLTGKEHTK